MKKNDQDISLSETEIDAKQNLYSESYKTTNVNILLNRVRADKKKEKLETFLIISLVFLSVLATGLIVSL